MTSYDDVFGLFLSKTDDYDIVKELNEDIDMGKEMLVDFLKSAIPRFTYSIKDLSNRSDLMQEFNITLTELEKEILATLMIVEYLSPKVLRSNLLESRLGSKDYKEFSPANQLKEIRELRKYFKSEADGLMNEYYYRQGY